VIQAVKKKKRGQGDERDLVGVREAFDHRVEFCTSPAR
jgi:hypothetical protein